MRFDLKYLDLEYLPNDHEDHPHQHQDSQKTSSLFDEIAQKLSTKTKEVNDRKREDTE